MLDLVLPRIKERKIRLDNAKVLTWGRRGQNNYEKKW
jgi:hypothetical protein